MERRQASKFYPHFNQEERPVIDYFTGLFNQIIFKHDLRVISCMLCVISPSLLLQCLPPIVHAR